MMNPINYIMEKMRKAKENDPVRSCPVHIEIGCSHVDGMICDMRDCNILDKYREDINSNTPSFCRKAKIG